MNIKKLLLTICISFITISALAQTQTSYFTNKGKKVFTPDSADYTQIIAKDSTSATLYNVTERYKNGNLKSQGKSTRKDYISWVGHYTRYYANGNKQEEGIYINNRLTGNFSEYFPNGVLHSVKEYVSDNPANSNNIGIIRNYRTLFKTCNDSTGTPILVNGNGHYVGYHEGYQKIYEEGYVKNGERIGQWTGKSNDKDAISFTEEYESGKLIKGTSTDKNGKVYNYILREAPPEYIGGEAAFSRFLIDNVRYPKEAKKNNITGRVFISFVIERDGSLTDAKAMRAPSQDLADEGLRVLRLSPKWQPGIQYGQPVRVQYTVPINFSLRE